MDTLHCADQKLWTKRTDQSPPSLKCESFRWIAFQNYTAAVCTHVLLEMWCNIYTELGSSVRIRIEILFSVPMQYDWSKPPADLDAQSSAEVCVHGKKTRTVVVLVLLRAFIADPSNKPLILLVFLNSSDDHAHVTITCAVLVVNCWTSSCRNDKLLTARVNY